MKRLLLFFAIFTSVNFSQTAISKFPLCEEGRDYYYSSLLELPDNSQIIIYSEGDSLFSSKSFDGGEIWQKKKFIKFTKSENLSINNFQAIIDSNNSILISSPNRINNNSVMKSNDFGETWNSTKLYSENLSSSLEVINDSIVWLLTTKKTYNDGPFMEVETSNYESEDNGTTWAPLSGFEGDYLISGELLNVISIEDSTLFGLITKTKLNEEDYLKLFGVYSYDMGETWIDEFPINSPSGSVSNSQLIKLENRIFLVYTLTIDPYVGDSESTVNNRTTLAFITSEDRGKTWSTENIITEYAGTNSLPQTNILDGKLYTTFYSDRFNENNIYIAETTNSLDTLTPPKITTYTNISSISTLETVKIYVQVFDNQSNSHTVNLHYGLDKNNLVEIQMTHDSLNYYSFESEDFRDGDTVYYKVIVNDDENYTIESELKTETIISDGLGKYPTKALMKINNFILPIDNRGFLGDVKVRDLEGEYYNGEFFTEGLYKEKSILFSSGFGLSGYDDNNQLWANASVGVFRIADYIGGTLNNLDNRKFIIYNVSEADSAFGNSWKIWKDAVSLGAYFYDGDNDGVYKPVDKNNNGIWDSDEDKPDILGDQTFWTVYNDGKPSEERYFKDQSPKGIEIRQTIWGYNKNNGLDNTLFIRYSILSRKDNFNDLIFSVIADPDIGSIGGAYTDDRDGCDTLLSSGYVYNDSTDSDFGENPPSLFISLLQGPEIESNSESCSYNRKGFLGIDSTLGYKNSEIASFLGWTKTVGLDSPHNIEGLRNFMEAKYQIGEYIDPCNFFYGEVYNEDCSVVDPKYNYSGDPVKKNGWINHWPSDAKIFLNSAQFTLEKEKPVDIIVAYIIGDGESALNSVEVGKKYAKEIQAFYESNFTDYVVSINEEKTETIPSKFTLSQNYPNPFNPTTTIEYSIPFVEALHATSVHLIVYDILGREVTTLVNKKQTAGNYKITFDASNLSSGIYFYKLQTGQKILTKKMILLK